MEQNDIKYQKALDILTSTIGEDVEQRYDYIINSRLLSSREKIFNLYVAIIDSFSRDTIHLVTIVENEMQNLLPVDSYDGAINLLHEINKRNNELNAMPKIPNPNNPDAPLETNRMSDESLKKLVVRKMGSSPTFLGLMDNIAYHPEWSWAKVQQVIRDTHMRISSSDVVLVKATQKSDVQSFADSSTAVMKVNADVTNIPKFKGQRSNGEKKRCWNCRVDGPAGIHYVTECPALFCRNCSVFWDSKLDKTYHNAAVCPKRPDRKRQGESEREDKKKVSCVKVVSSSSSTASIWDQFCKEAALTIVNDDGDDVEQVINSVLDVYLSSSSSNYLVCGINTQGQSTHNIESSMVMIDSGAAVSITHPSVAKLWDVPILLLSQPTVVHFANNTTAEANYMANFGSILGKVLLCSEVSSTLISAVQISRRHIKCCIEFGMVLIKDMNDTVMIEKVISYDVGLPYISIESFLNLDCNQFKFIHYPQPQYVGSIALKKLADRFKEPPVTKEQYMSVIRFHERMGHLNPAVLSKALKSNAWVCSEAISPALIDKVFRHYN